MENVILANVGTREKAHGALEALRRLRDDGEIDLRGAVIVERDLEGNWRVPEETEEASYAGTITGGAVGGLIGLLAGPVGLLLGAAAGLMAGSAAEVDDIERVESILHALPSNVPPGATAMVADVFEETPDAIDSALGRFGATVTRMSRERVEADLAEAERQAEEEAAREK